MRRYSRIRPLIASFGLSLFLEPCWAQCQTWSQEFGTSIGGTADALLPFDDGSGPVLWVGGDVGVGAFPSDNVARWNGTNWIYTPGLDDAVTSFGVFDDGHGPSLYVGGLFDTGIARWNGTGWATLGAPPGSGLFGDYMVWAAAMTSFDSGSGPELYIGGTFHGGGATDSFAIIRWDGTNWHPLGSGLGPTSGSQVAQVYALQVFDDGSGSALYVAGTFTTAGGVPVNDIARWNGTGWSAVGTGADGPDHVVTALSVFDDGAGPALYAAGSFASAGSNIARWDGTRWTGIPNPLQLSPYALFAFDDGTGRALYAAGIKFGFNVSIARWDGHSWSTMGGGLDGIVPSNAAVYTLALTAFDEGHGHGPELFVGGGFVRAGGGIRSQTVAKWTSCNRPIESICVGDGTFAKCPCANVGLPGHGCENSDSSGGALLSADGNTTPDNLVLTCSGELPTTLSVILQGTSTSESVTSFGDGLRCIDGHLSRLYVKTAQAGTVTAPSGADPSISVRSAELGDPIAHGSVRLYQVYYRDPSPTYCASPRGGLCNISNGMRVTW
jgi:hypothetical protein